MLNIFDFSPQQLEIKFLEWKQPNYRVTQLVDALWREGITNFSDAVFLPKTVRNQLSNTFYIPAPFRLFKQLKDSDGTVKIGFQLSDQQVIESVAIPKADRLTFCISTQLGCAMGCRFCATAQLGFRRNLSAGEIIGQIRGLIAFMNKNPSNIVFMGMGEPLQNIDAIRSVLDQLIHPNTLKWSAKKSVISTCGWLPGLETLIHSPIKAKLALSLNAVDNESRNQIMPINRRFPLEIILPAIRNYAQITGDTISIEYILFHQFNDSVEHARILSRLFKNQNVKINLIPYNPIDGLPFQAPDPEKAQSFMHELQKNHLLTTLRSARGQSIQAACGQLAGQSLRTAA